MESGMILVAQITTSTVLEDDLKYSGNNARLNAQPDAASAGAWFAAFGDVTPYIEVRKKGSCWGRGVVGFRFVLG